MSELFEQDLALSPQEIERLLKQTRDAAFHPDENAPRKQRGDFKKSNLIEIARAVSDEKRIRLLLMQKPPQRQRLKIMRPPSIHQPLPLMKICPRKRKAHLLRLKKWR